MRILSMFTLATAIALASPARAQDLVGPGFALTAQQPVPVANATYSTLPSGERVVFDGLTVDLYGAGGQFIANLGSLPGFVFPSFVALSPGGTTALIGESSNGDLFRVDLGGGGLSFVANAFFNYDAVFLDETFAVVSAATCGFGCGNDLLRVNVQTGALQDLAEVPGSSGAVALGPGGALYYALVSGAFSPPPGSAQIIRWTAAQVASGLRLTVGDAQVVVPALDGGASMAVDGVLGGIVVAESIFGATSRVRLYSAGGNLVATVIESQEWLSSVELRAGGGAGHFYPYQPANGVYLTYSSAGQIHTIRPQRPQASLVQQGSVFDLVVSGAPPGGGMLVLWQSAALWNPIETSYSLPSLGFQFHTGVPPASLRRLQFFMPVDAGGQGVFSYFDPGSATGTLVFQTLLLDAAGQFVGSSTSVGN